MTLPGTMKFDDAAHYYGRTITAAELLEASDGAPYLEPRLQLTFDDGVRLCIMDVGQSCCEHRYLTCDDDLTALIGGKLTRVEMKDNSAEDTGGWDDAVHEMQFVEVGTDKGFVTLCTHNQHNGYYGGFMLVLWEART